MNVVIYARFSSHSQTEQSIEGQLKVCYEYAESNHYTVVGEYIDRAISGTTDNRAEFQRMISDSDKHTFEGVLVYQLDRFARNRYDSAINKAKLKKNGVRVLSAKENIADDASGILVEGVLESMAEYYSVELSQKIHRGMAINAEKCLSNGSNPGLGFKVDAERRFYVDEEEAAIVREIYERYASGETKAEIIRDLKRRRVKTSLGKEFSPNSLSHLLSNKRYIGVYLYKGKETPGGMPRILDDDLFYRVQSMMSKNKNAPARTHGEGEYLLTTKLFCGHCKEMMVGYGGTSKTGRQYHYYMCKNARRKKCGKKIVSKSYIEDRVVNECLKMLTEEKIRFIAKKVAEECTKSPDNLTAKTLRKAIREADAAIENLWKAIEQGQAVDMLTDRLNKRMAEKAELEAQLAIEENKKITLTEAQILAFLDYVCEMPADDVNKRRAIINIFVHSIYLYDDHFTLIINASKKPLSIDNIPLDDIETAFEGETGALEGCSSLSTPAPPNTKPPHTGWFCVWYKVGLEDESKAPSISDGGLGETCRGHVSFVSGEPLQIRQNGCTVLMASPERKTGTILAKRIDNTMAPQYNIGVNYAIKRQKQPFTNPSLRRSLKMKKKTILRTIIAALALVLLMTALCGCGGKNNTAETSEGTAAAEPVSPSQPAEAPAAEAGRQDGERFEAVIMLEGMEETVHYEHIRNDALGIEMDFDYESFVRRSEGVRECFISAYDDPENPENYLEVTYRGEDADTVAASVNEELSQTYDLLTDSRQLDGAGSCTYIEASVLKGTGTMADQLQAVYVIPASDGCRVATAHYAVEGAEGFGRRFDYMLNTLAVIDIDRN